MYLQQLFTSFLYIKITIEEPFRGGGQEGKHLPPPVPSLLPPVPFVNCLPPPAPFVNCLPPPAFFHLTWVCCYY